MFLEQGAGYYLLWNFTELYTYDLCTFLYCYTLAKSLKNLLDTKAIKFILHVFISAQIISVIIKIVNTICVSLTVMLNETIYLYSL